MIHTTLRPASTVAAIAIAAGLVLGIPAAAEAHTPGSEASCSGVTLHATNYQADQTNQWSMTVNGVTQSGTFVSSFSKTIPVPQNYTTSTYTVSINVVQSDQYDYNKSGSVGPCGTVTVPVAVAPTKVDECNGPGVTSNIHWASVPPSTADYAVTGTATTDLTFTLKAGRTWSDSTTAPKHFALGVDSGVICPTPKPPPIAMPPTFAPPAPVTPAPKHAVTHVTVVDKCNCYRDKVTMTGGPNVSIRSSHPSNTLWVFKVTGKVRDGVQYLLPSKVGGHSGWAASQVYQVRTTNTVCPCVKHHTCHQLYPGFTPPPNACLGRNGC